MSFWKNDIEAEELLKVLERIRQLNPEWTVEEKKGKEHRIREGLVSHPEISLSYRSPDGIDIRLRKYFDVIYDPVWICTIFVHRYTEDGLPSASIYGKTFDSTKEKDCYQHLDVFINEMSLPVLLDRRLQARREQELAESKKQAEKEAKRIEQERLEQIAKDVFWGN